MAQSDISSSARAESKIDTLKAVFPGCLQLPGGDGGGFHVAWGDRAQAGIQRLHDQALVGAERSRVGSRLGLHALSKPDDDMGTSRRENAFIPVFKFVENWGLTMLLMVLISPTIWHKTIKKQRVRLTSA